MAAALFPPFQARIFDFFAVKNVVLRKNFLFPDASVSANRRPVQIPQSPHWMCRRMLTVTCVGEGGTQLDLQCLLVHAGWRDPGPL
jgi:hypothetical protein